LAIGPSASEERFNRPGAQGGRCAICRRPGRVLQAALHRAGRRVVRTEGHKGSDGESITTRSPWRNGRPFGLVGVWENWKKPAFAISRPTRVARN